MYKELNLNIEVDGYSRNIKAEADTIREKNGKS
jgi:hypothetical protein